MINKIINIAKLSQFTQDSRIKSFNTTLPILLQVLKKTNSGYLLKLGNSTLEARSANELQIGAKYWAMVRESSVGEMLISKLIKQPEIINIAKNTSLKFEIEEFRAMLESRQFITKFSEILLDKSINTNIKDDFSFLTNSLLALKQDIINLVIKEEGKDILLQFRKPKNAKIDFSAVFNNLGMLEGSIYDNDKVLLKVQYENVRQILLNNANKLSSFSEVVIVLDENVRLLYNMEQERILEA